ncbi:MAG: DNA-processing protein DprA [Gemmatimonadota bacterium]
MTAADDDPDRLARAVLTCIAEPGDPVLGKLLRRCPPAGIVAALVAGRSPLSGGQAGLPFAPEPGTPGADGPGGGEGGAVPRGAGHGSEGAGGAAEGGEGPGGAARLTRALRRWSARLGDAPGAATVAGWRQQGIRLIVPGDPEWPGQLDVLGDARPWALWVRGNADLRYACLRSVSVVGSRAATGYGSYVASEMAGVLAGHGWAVVSGGAFGIDYWAHQGALAGEGVTVAILAGGVDVPYPPAHRDLFRAIAGQGALVSEWPPGRHPTRPGFLVRNRVIAALSRGTVVVEAALRSGALNTARHARDQGRPVMAVPGPVTSEQSAGCHQVLREWGAVCVTGARDVMELLAFPGDGLPPRERGPVLPRDALDPVTTRVLEAVPVRSGRGPARIAVIAGVDFGTALGCLGVLAAGGFVERTGRGWRARLRPGDRTGGGG